jgi:type I restriction enzyme S subunit
MYYKEYNLRLIFNKNLAANDPVYINIRDYDTPSLIAARQFTKKLWRQYYPYADTNFTTEIGNHFHERFWEMYLACTLMHYRIVLNKKDSNEGPDIKVNYTGTRIWIEAIAPKGGEPDKPDSVIEPEITPGEVVAREVPDKQIILRYRNAIYKKYDNKYQSYVSNGLISYDDCYVIAINGCQIPWCKSELTLPRIVRSVFPLGWPIVTLDTVSKTVIQSGYQYRPSINKTSGNPVSTDIFLNPQYEHISAILFSNIDVCNPVQGMGLDFIWVHNPLALKPLPEDFISSGREYRAMQEGTEWKLVSKEFKI